MLLFVVSFNTVFFFKGRTPKYERQVIFCSILAELGEHLLEHVCASQAGGKTKKRVLNRKKLKFSSTS
jgi:hypothetical protein